MSFRASELAIGDRLTLSLLAVMWCQREDFRRWLGVDSVAAARATILQKCNVTSRAELDRDPPAAKAFDEHFRIPFAAHLEQHRAGLRQPTTTRR